MNGRILVLSIFGILGLGAGIYFLTQAKTQDILAPAEKPPGLEERYEEVLNTMLVDMARAMQDYKIMRRAYVGLAEMEDLRAPDYLAENYQLMLDMKPELLAKMENIIAIFSAADRNMKALAGEGEGELAWESWRRVKERQIAPYLDYFATEKRILNAYEDLLRLYYENVSATAYNEMAGGLIFEDPALLEDADELRQRIAALSAEQAGIFQENR